MKLASGIAQLPELIAAGVNVLLGADGAPCNNNLDAFQGSASSRSSTSRARDPAPSRPRRYGSRRPVAPAALGLADQIGSLEVGKRGDVIAVDITPLHTVPAASPWSQIAYAARACDVKHVAVDSQVVVRDRTLQTLDLEGPPGGVRGTSRLFR